MKPCSTCKVTLPLIDFAKNKAKPDGLQNICKACRKIWYANYYKTSPKEKLRLYKDRDALRDSNFAWVTELKNVPCADCGNSFPSCVMDFDHLGEKSFAIAQSMARPRAALEREIAKCEVVCANCHRIRTHITI